ncbi:MULTISPECIES: phosphate ABC transporter ATP-binding protein PstB [Candidatus Ichthyocystis]|uniref:Phosphate transporter system, ATP-binding protein n=1 Tax=Candidatus Ichthyocystis hellenicum TaxID=1561003 RepID=A0A0S4M2C0_9BURK|nr:MULTISPECIES: phosphate ABC transporter ATP-binding protein PstB [Ichthyocystis]CUT17838.1 phosphate transporter system, ATP-binding protein [Candidatus Ichthyocystis hellenicum]
MTSEPALKCRVKDFNFYYGDKHTLKDINLNVYEKKITALIGPSGCGKSTLLRAFNRMHDLYYSHCYAGSIYLYPEDVNLLDVSVDPIRIRSRIGMVFQKPNIFPLSIYDNVAYGLRIAGGYSRSFIDDKIKDVLISVGLWSEVDDRLRSSAYNLSGGQQQRLCIARALATGPEMLLFDEPTSALDPIATSKVEDLMVDLRDNVTILVVTHNMQQAARVSDYTAYMYLGELVEFGETRSFFVNPQDKRTEDYITGRVG